MEFGFKQHPIKQVVKKCCLGEIVYSDQTPEWN